MYQINEVAKISGVSTRTLRYYDEIGLLKPADISEAGYRIYSDREIDRLQQICFYKTLDFKLEKIKLMIEHPEFDIIQALNEQHRLLRKKKEDIDQLLVLVEQTIKYKKGEIHMTNEEKFETFKKQMLEENEKNYGVEIREKYGEEAVKGSNKQWMNITESQFERANQIEQQLIDALNYLLDHSVDDLNDFHAREAFESHKSWLTLMNPNYSAAYHKALGEMYVSDERFASYYNERTHQNSVVLLKNIIDYYAK